MSRTKWYAKPIYLLVALALVVSLAIVALPMAGTMEADPGTIQVDVNEPACVTGGPQLDPYACVYCNIQDAVNDAAVDDTIIVAAGTYNENVVVWKDVTLKSAKKHKAEVVGVDVGVGAGWAWDVFRVVADGATVEGFRVRMYPGPVVHGHDGIGVKASDVTVRDNIVEGPGHFTGTVPKTGWGISVIPDDAKPKPGGTCGEMVWNKGEECNACIIEGNDIRGTTGGGIWVIGIDCLIRNNRVEGTQFTGILLPPWWGWVDEDTEGMKYSHGNLIAENKVKKCGTQWQADDGIRLGDGAYNNVLYDNRVISSSNSGIRAVGTTYDNTIVGNKISHSANFDAEDGSIGTRTAGRANWWVGNKGKTESPAGLLD